MIIVPYSPKYRKDFDEMNKAWISDMFEMEPEDEREIANIEPYIRRGGRFSSPWMTMAVSWHAA